MTVMVSAILIIVTNSAGLQLFLTTASVSDYNEIGGEAWMDYPTIRLPITQLLLPAAVITDDRIIITWPPDQKRSAAQYQLSA